MTIAQRRYDFAPLEAHFCRTHRHHSDDRLSPRQGATIGQTAGILGIGRGNLYRYKREGLPMATADRLAIRIGIHPVILWPDFYDDVSSPDD